MKSKYDFWTITTSKIGQIEGLRTIGPTLFRAAVATSPKLTFEKNIVLILLYFTIIKLWLTQYGIVLVVARQQSSYILFNCIIARNPVVGFSLVLIGNYYV